MVVSTECGLQVGFDGIHIVKVVAPSVLSQMMTGICGDCDGIKNDRRLKNGSDVSKMPDADTLVADSYREPMEPDKSNQDCYAHPVNNNCVDNNVITNYCAIIRNRTGPFGKCIEAFPDIAEEYYQACRIDVCSYQQNVFMIDEVGCDAVTSMADACEENGILVNWRSSEFCPVICPSVNTTYSYHMTGCPATCVDPDSPKTCTQPDTEGCQCAPGLLLSDDVCVEPSKCGCKDPNGNYLPVGTKKILSDCRHTINCEMINGKARLTTAKNQACGSHASCVLEMVGTYHCKCDPGYSGDPHVKCSKTSGDIMLGDSPMKCNKCHPMADCLDGRCVCKPGFLGNGITFCEDKCFCMVGGDPLYITFDGQLINYQGSCSYLLSKSTVPGNLCEFQIHIKNKLFADRPRIVMPEKVHLEIYGHSYYISKNETYVDDQLKYPPSIHLDGKVQLFRSGNSNGVSTKCGIQVFFSDQGGVKVVIPRSYSQKITGLCGDCNHVHDDFRLSNGTNVAKNPHRHNLVGDSYLAQKYNDDEQCRGPESILCSKLSQSSAKSHDKCGLMEDTKGPFKQCIINAPDLADQFFNACWQDLCLHGSKQDIICQKLSTFADMCATLGFPAEWRSNEFCPTNCPKGMEYKNWSPGCQASCAEPSPKSCDRFNSEGCSCMIGYVISGHSCVKSDQCGCFHNKTGDYVPLGSKFVSTDCEKFECKLQNGKASLVNAGKIKCAQHARCTVFANQTFGCACQEGYTGNGLTHCKVSTVRRSTEMPMLADQPQLCPKCHQRASCKYNQCVCHKEFYGDGVNSCEKQCVCRATGDPHYATYDGAWFHYMGVCRYLMTQRLQSGRCDFRITAKNGYRNGLKGTQILWIELEMFGNSYRIEKSKGKNHPILLFNKVAKEIGKSFDGDQITASRYGRCGIILKTSCNLSVSFDGETAAISVEHSPGLILKGMCGDCDGNKGNDLPKKGSLMTHDHIVYGDTWRLPDPSDKPGKTCEGLSPVKCTANQERLARLNKNCGQLLDTTGPFKECITYLQDIMNEQFLNCKLEFCIVGASQRGVTCPKLKVAASICAAHGFVVRWRTDSFCPATCSVNQQYNPFASGCQPTCANPKAKESCTFPPVENCVCNAGFILNEETNECVKNCPHDFDKLPADSPEGLTPKKKCGWYTCADNADCKKVNGKQKCICQDGFAGNGIDVCDKAHCACSASGDPHYITFDSTSLYLLGDCKYTMARTVDDSKCPFKVEVKNEHRLYSKFPTRAFTRLVDIKIDGHVYQLHLYKHLYVDKKKQSMPYKNPSGTVTVEMEGKFMKLESQCGLKVRFDGVHAVVITLPDRYAGKVEGICGNCDGNPKNDLMLSGRDLSHTANKTMAYEEFARQYLLVDDSDQPATDPICRVKS